MSLGPSSKLMPVRQIFHFSRQLGPVAVEVVVHAAGDDLEVLVGGRGGARHLDHFVSAERLPVLVDAYSRPAPRSEYSLVARPASVAFGVMMLAPVGDCV